MVTIYREHFGPEKVSSDFPACPNYGPSFFAVDGPTKGGPSVCSGEKLEGLMALFTDRLVYAFDRDLSEGGAIVLVRAVAEKVQVFVIIDIGDLDCAE
jgi:hypothetical protein